MIVVYLIWGDHLNSGAALLWFAVSAVLAYLISYLIDFLTGVVSFYTESIWGISVAKETVVLFFAGAVVPLGFFPEAMQKVLIYLPFQAVYHTPISILTDTAISTGEIVQSIGIQSLWLLIFVVISRLFYNRSLKTVTVNGG